MSYYDGAESPEAVISNPLTWPRFPILAMSKGTCIEDMRVSIMHAKDYKNQVHVQFPLKVYVCNLFLLPCDYDCSNLGNDYPTLEYQSIEALLKDWDID